MYQRLFKQQERALFRPHTDACVAYLEELACLDGILLQEILVILPRHDTVRSNNVILLDTVEHGFDVMYCLVLETLDTNLAHTRIYCSCVSRVSQH